MHLPYTTASHKLPQNGHNRSAVIREVVYNPYLPQQLKNRAGFHFTKIFQKI